MSRKTFKSSVSNREVHVWKATCGSAIAVTDDASTEGMSTQVAPSDAPALCLAILEAAGWPNEHLATAEILRRLRELDEHVKAMEAEAKELAELEAEAVELFNANHGTNRTDWDHADRSVISSWLAVARRAREMRTEK